ncbi:plasma kallikrein-like [Mercenaria mercenaria]|uniref:plasma kallikrein-like n=1 Tax=Mercenaria mercenaria TaxID=6596 RepID=UPI00234EE33A|nr:plasma kallikrein-like [Mercenaria mercenaria]
MHLASPLKFSPGVQPVRLSGTFFVVFRDTLLLNYTKDYFSKVIKNIEKSIENSKFDEEALTNTQCYLSGWGRMMGKGSNSYELPKDLQEINAHIITNDDCRKKEVDVEITKRHVCATYNGFSSSCSGDSGGPMGCYDNDGNFRLIGVDSFGRQPCGITTGAVTGYMRISQYRRWISKNALGQVST